MIHQLSLSFIGHSSTGLFENRRLVLTWVEMMRVLKRKKCRRPRDILKQLWKL